jgi:hypothetical protein
VTMREIQGVSLRSSGLGVGQDRAQRSREALGVYLMTLDLLGSKGSQEVGAKADRRRNSMLNRVDVLRSPDVALSTALP